MVIYVFLCTSSVGRGVLGVGEGVWVIGRAMVVFLGAGGEVLLKLSTFSRLKSKSKNRPKYQFSTAVISLERISC